MNRLYAAFAIVIFSFLFIGCGKNSVPASGSEFELYGKWARRSNPGDTLEFLRKNNRNIMRKLESSSQGPFYSETEYRFADGNLGLKYAPGEYTLINSFIWTQPGIEFTILGFQVFLYMSSPTTVFTYRKI
jgi:hypothetical protein